MSGNHQSRDSSCGYYGRLTACRTGLRGEVVYGVRHDSPLANPNRSVRPSRESCGSSLRSRRCPCLCPVGEARWSERFAKRGRRARESDDSRRHAIASRARRSVLRHTNRVAARYASTRARCVAAVAAREARSWCGATGPRMRLTGGCQLGLRRGERYFRSCCKGELDVLERTPARVAYPDGQSVKPSRGSQAVTSRIDML